MDKAGKFEVTIEEEEIDENSKVKKYKKKYALGIAVAATYHPETNTIVIAAVCKDTDENEHRPVRKTGNLPPKSEKKKKN